MVIFGDTLTEHGDSLDFSVLEKIIKRPVIQPRFRISVLNQDESVNYVIPEEDIPLGGISYTEEYTSGQRRNISLTLINDEGKYTPSINGIWLTTKFRFDIGLKVSDEIIWFPRGVYVMGDVDLSNSADNKNISIQLKDKFSIFQDKMGTLQDAYEIEVDSDIQQVLHGLMNSATGSGQIFDYKEVYFDPSLLGFKTQATIRVEEGGTIGDVIDSLATQLSAEYYYNNMGNLCFYPINSTVDDSVKPIIWTYKSLNKEVLDMSMSYKNTEVINVVKVVGDNITSGVKYAVVENNNAASPICIQQIGRRTGEIIQDSNIWSNDQAVDLANYHLRKASFVGIDFSCEVSFNPLLTVNNICEVEDEFLELKREKLLITSLSYSSESGVISLKLCNTSELPSTHRRA